MIDFALIGGSGLYLPDMLDNAEEKTVDTPFGSIVYACGSFNGKKIIFIPRHGKGHSVPPHKINYQANIYGLKKLGVKRIIASAAVGSINVKMQVGELVIPNQIIDFTKLRKNTFFEGEDGKVVHTDFTNPYCGALSDVLFKSACLEGIKSHNKGTYICTEGPRFETSAEINMYRLIGGDIVGMTAMPEAILAREANICYASFALVTNLAAGLSENLITHQEVFECMKSTNEKLKPFIKKALSEIVKMDNKCACQTTISEAESLKI